MSVSRQNSLGTDEEVIGDAEKKIIFWGAKGTYEQKKRSHLCHRPRLPPSRILTRHSGVKVSEYDDIIIFASLKIQVSAALQIWRYSRLKPRRGLAIPLVQLVLSNHETSALRSNRTTTLAYSYMTRKSQEGLSSGSL